MYIRRTHHHQPKPTSCKQHAIRTSHHLPGPECTGMYEGENATTPFPSTKAASPAPSVPNLPIEPIMVDAVPLLSCYSQAGGGGGDCQDFFPPHSQETLIHGAPALRLGKVDLPASFWHSLPLPLALVVGCSSVCSNALLQHGRKERRHRILVGCSAVNKPVFSPLCTKVPTVKAVSTKASLSCYTRGSVPTKRRGPRRRASCYTQISPQTYVGWHPCVPSRVILLRVTLNYCSFGPPLFFRVSEGSSRFMLPISDSSM